VRENCAGKLCGIFAANKATKPTKTVQQSRPKPSNKADQNRPICVNKAKLSDIFAAVNGNGSGSAVLRFCGSAAVLWQSLVFVATYATALCFSNIMVTEMVMVMVMVNNEW
jgi:hypothetical protein